jgi:Ca-activated chloride channel homolog
MRRSGAMDAMRGHATLAAKYERKFGLRHMKSQSLRRFGFAIIFLLVFVHSSFCQDKPDKPDTPAPKPEAIPTQSVPQQPAAPAQPITPQQSDVKAKIISTVNLVILPVTVKKNGVLVPDLHRDEFRIFEDNVEQNIDFFTAEAFPLSIVILIDNDLKSKDTDQVEKSLRAVVAGMSTNDEAFVCRFDQYFHPGKGFTRDQDKLLTELKRIDLDSEPSVAPPSAAINQGPTINGHSPIGDSPNISGGTMNIKGRSTKALDDAVYSAAQLLKDRGRDRRKMIILISDGLNGIRSNTNSYDNTVKDLLRYNVSVYSVGVGSSYFDRKFSRLEDYAHATAGDIYFAAKANAMEELYARVTEEARNQYTLAYSPRGTDRAKEYHDVEVRVKREGVKIQTRDRYYSSSIPK